jgi:peptide/nickel transport system permease protein
VLVVALVFAGHHGHGSRPIPSMSPAASTPPASVRPRWPIPFGTNELGQDVFSLVLAGTRVSLFAGLAVVHARRAVGTSSARSPAMPGAGPMTS